MKGWQDRCSSSVSLWYTRFSGSVGMIPLFKSVPASLTSSSRGSPPHSGEEYITIAHISEFSSDRYTEDDSIERV